MTIKLLIPGQLKSGKNNMGITRSGHHYPLKAWAAWRDQVVKFIFSQYSGDTIAVPCKISIHYWAGDKRRRDVPGMEDALWHCLEKALIVTDDKLFTEVHWFSDYEKGNPRTEVLIEV